MRFTKSTKYSKLGELSYSTHTNDKGQKSTPLVWELTVYWTGSSRLIQTLHPIPVSRRTEVVGTKFGYDKTEGFRRSMTVNGEDLNFGGDWSLYLEHYYYVTTVTVTIVCVHGPRDDARNVYTSGDY